MRRFFRLPNLLLFAFGIFLVNACTVDEEPFVLGPNVSFGTGTDFLATDATIAGGTAIRVNLIATKGDNPMQAVEFLENGVRMEDFNSRITINGTAANSNLPLLTGTEEDEINWDISIVPHASGTSTYTFSVQDNSQNANQVSLDITVEDAEPTLSFVGQGTDVMVIPNTWHSIKVSVETNGSPLTSISVWEDDVLVSDLSSLAFGDIATNFSDNPHPLAGDDVNGFVDKDLYIKPGFAGTAKFTIQVENAAGKTASGDFNLVSGSSLTAEYTAVLLSNAEGLNVLGGLDLYTGTNVSVFSDDATIIDNGIDNSGDPLTNWIQKISPANGASMRELSQSQVDSGFNFESINSKELLQNAWDNATLVNEATNQVQVGDVFLVGNGADLFIISCVELNVTTASNEDNYKFDIKQAIF